jgi:hypothetical protein
MPTYYEELKMAEAKENERQRRLGIRRDARQNIKRQNAFLEGLRKAKELRELEEQTLAEQGDLPPPLDTTPQVPRSSVTPLLYSNEETPVTYRQLSNIKANLQSPYTRMKPLLPNILDHAAVMSVHKYRNLRKRSGHKWAAVQEK